MKWVKVLENSKSYSIISIYSWNENRQGYNGIIVTYNQSNLEKKWVPVGTISAPYCQAAKNEYLTFWRMFNSLNS